MRQLRQRGQSRSVEGWGSRTGHRVDGDLVHLAGGESRCVQRLLQAARQRHDQAQSRDPDGDAGRGQGRAQRAPPGAAEPHLHRVAPVQARGRVERFLAAHRRLAGFELDRAAVDHADDSPGVARDLRVVGHQHDRGAAGVQVFEQRQNALACGRVQAAGRFVGQDQTGPVGEGSRHRDLLLLPARQAPGAGPPTLLQADQLEEVARSAPALLELDTGQREGKRHVVLDRHRRDEVEGLKDRADALQAVVRQVPVRQLAQGQARTVDVPGRRAV